MSALTIALDVMGGDHGPSVTVPASAQALSLYPQLNLLLVGDEQQLRPYLQQYRLLEHPRLSLVHASQVVTMEDKPAYALRHLNDSSMRLALDLLYAGKAQACVSAGNTGALMGMARHVLKLVPGVDRPALTTSIPTVSGGKSVLLDLGANVNCTPEHLHQFALMGSVVAESVHGIGRPRVALLNIGVEQNKGNEEVREAAARMAADDRLNYTGFIEGDALFAGQADVIVCDGFVGNIALKTAEGMVRLLSQSGAQTRSPYANWLQWLLRRYMRRRLSHLNPDQYNGASLLGLRGIVIKSHGRAEICAFFNAIEQAIAEVDRCLPVQIARRFESHTFTGA